MPPWVKRQIDWTTRARAGLLLLRAAGQDDAVAEAVAALGHYAATGQAPHETLKHFRKGPFRGHSRLRDPHSAEGWRLVFLDYPERRLIQVVRFALRADVYRSS